LKKVLFITHSSSLVGGAEDEFERLLRYFSKKNEKYEIHGLFPIGPRSFVYSSYCSKWGFYRMGYLPVIYEGLFNYIKYIIKSVIQAYQILNFTYGCKYDLCVINVVVLVFPALIMRLKGTKVVLFIREDIYPVKLRHFIYKLLSMTCTFFIPNSITKKNDFIKTTKDKRVKYIYPGIEDINEKFENSLSNIFGEEKFKKIAEKNRFKFINTGRIFKKKNQFLILKALKVLKSKSFDNMPYVIFVGAYDLNSDYGKMMNKYIVQNELNDYCIFLDSIPRMVLYELYKYVDASLLTSFSEGMPIVLVESLKFGKPFISTKVGGIQEIITDFKNGFLVDFDEIQLSQVMHRLMCDTKLYAEVTKNGFLTFKEYFNLSKSLIETEYIIDKIIYKKE
jgi:glycosyltransferase involved in cell wall biosynthesis